MMITKLDGTLVKCNGNIASFYIYDDYIILDWSLLKKYKINFKLNILTNKTLEIIENAKIHKDLIFKIDNISKFISTSIELILAEINKNYTNK